MGFGKLVAFQIVSQVDQAKAGLVSEQKVRQSTEQRLSRLSEADRQEALEALSQEARRRNR